MPDLATVPGPASASGGPSAAGASAGIEVEVANLHKQFGPTVALRDVSVRFLPGEVHCLLGENGAGKSTLGKIIGGLYPPDSGTVRVQGATVTLNGVADAHTRSIGIVFQELSLAPDLSVQENICLGTERAFQPFAMLQRRREADRCRRLLADLSLGVPLSARVADLSTATQQLVEIAKALFVEPRVLILDEPTAMLGAAEKQKFFAILRRLKQQRTTVVFITHHIEEVLEVGDRVTVMKDGAIAHSFPITPEIDLDFVVEKLAGRRISRSDASGRRPVGEEIVRISQLPHTGSEADIVVHAGEIVGLYGVVGCGREQLASALVGLAEAAPARLTLSGRHYSPRSAAEAARRGVAYLPAGRAANCVLPTRSIRENLMIGQFAGLHRLGVISGTKERREGATRLDRVHAKYRAADDLITALSGGNQQKVLVGRVLGSMQPLVVLEDPTAGIDIAAKQEIHELLRRRASEGAAVLLLSSDLLETMQLCTTIYTIFKGKLVARYENPQHDDQAAILADVLGSRVELERDPRLQRQDLPTPSLGAG